MARTELPNGVILPAEYSDDWYEDMTSNLTKLDDVIGSDSEKLNSNDVAFLRMSSAALTDGGTGNFSDLNSSNKLKTGDYVLDSGRKLYQIVSVNSTTETFTVGNSLFKVTAESDLAPVAESGDYDDLDNKPDLKPVATSGDYDDLTDLPTYGITRLCSSAITDNSTVAFSAISSTNKIKTGDFLLDINGKLYQISSVDTANETVSVTTPLTQLALDSGVMHLSGDETASGKKTFSDLATFNSYLYFTNSSVTKGTIPQTSVVPYRIYFGSGVNYGASLFNIDTSVSNTGVQSFIFRSAENVVSGDDARFALIYDPNRTQPRYLAVKGGIEPNANNTYDCGSDTNIWKNLYGYHGYFMGQNQNDEYSSNARTNLTLLSNRDTLGVSGVLFDTYRQNTAQGTGIHILGLSIKENSVRYEGCRWGWYWDNNLNGYYFDFKPTTQGTNQAIKHNLGTSTDKWDTINGINPGALSFPDLSNGLDISGYITAENTHNEYTPIVDGWISVIIKKPATSGAMAVFLYQGDVGNSYFGNTALPNDTEFCAMASIPVKAGAVVNIDLKGSNTYVYSAKFYPNLGNV